MLEKLLNSKEFLKEQTTFNLIPLILSSESLEYYTDGENYLICRSNADMPIWVWTKDDLSNNKLNEVLLKLDSMLDLEKVIQITSKDIVFKNLFENYKDIVVDNYFIQKGNYLQMRAYECNNLIKPKNIVGYRERPTLEDIDILAYFNKCDYEDVLTHEYSSKVTKEQLYESAKKHIENPNFYVWKVDGRIVATAGYTDNRIGMVFTNRTDRGNGYAGMIIYELCEEIIKEGKTPMLYVDADYYASNRAYQKIGFEPVGDLYNIKIGTSNMKEINR